MTMHTNQNHIMLTRILIILFPNNYSLIYYRQYLSSQYFILHLIFVFFVSLSQNLIASFLTYHYLPQRLWFDSHLQFEKKGFCQNHDLSDYCTDVIVSCIINMVIGPPRISGALLSMLWEWYHPKELLLE